METVGLNFPEMFDGIYRGRTVLVTGHTGFKGSWLSLWLHLMGANVIGYALDPVSQQDNFILSGLPDKMVDIRGNILDASKLKQVFTTYQPEIVFHLAAQPIVRHSYKMPVLTFETNVMGTVHVLENIRTSSTVKTGVIITSDKCYENREQLWGYREKDPLGGYDPYSASKGCAEIVTASYRKAYFSTDSGGEQEKSLASVRAGNVIGGGDWSDCRLLPDCIRALQSQKTIEIRNPNSIRPWQHVLEPLYGYLLLAAKMFKDGSRYSGAWNFGPDFDSVAPVKKVVEQVIALWGSGLWVDCSNQAALHEAVLLSLDCTKAKTLLGWQPRLTLHKALDYTLAWYKNDAQKDIYQLCKEQIAEYCMT
ncbi:CDP-glucose 4,6-dehydratase [Desulforamulus aeronauticus]|uniref:CDP-glucose 4,6-dehydratase n=1 Tax=Desulforamulus aeronauticus DSM 10349 TaxID=1121421 RepID=A0A1M6VKJ9_9FIRM|nr:CDP-glucose 4,6-dehydratase [Desulforamulus aeronauticus]SHK81988.1 CDP-glucose 4,6-dehydratase [Desulforamulus aeronauticus DSM 10349]